MKYFKVIFKPTKTTLYLLFSNLRKKNNYLPFSFYFHFFLVHQTILLINNVDYKLTVYPDTGKVRDCGFTYRKIKWKL